MCLVRMRKFFGSFFQKRMRLLWSDWSDFPGRKGGETQNEMMRILTKDVGEVKVIRKVGRERKRRTMSD